MEESVRKIGPYTLVSKLGSGTFGVVWLAEKRTAIATTRVALKLPRGEDIDLEAFKREAAIWVHASGHPNVLPLIDADVYDGQVVIVSEYAPDGSLEQWRNRHGGRAPSVEAACELMEGVLSGLAHLHDRRVIHRDLKPDNILLQRDTPRLADFGISRLLRASSHFTKNVSGTFVYMAPEAFDGKRDEQTDIWAAGVIFYELLAGRLPYDQQDTASLVGAIVRHDAPALPEGLVPEPVRRVVAKALRRDPAERYRSAKEMRDDLREAGHQLWLERHGPARAVPGTRLAGEARPPAPPPTRVAGDVGGNWPASPPAPPAPPTPRRHVWALVAFGALLVASLGYALAARSGGRAGGGSAETSARVAAAATPAPEPSPRAAPAAAAAEAPASTPVPTPTPCPAPAPARVLCTVENGRVATLNTNAFMRGEPWTQGAIVAEQFKGATVCVREERWQTNGVWYRVQVMDYGRHAGNPSWRGKKLLRGEGEAEKNRTRCAEGDEAAADSGWVKGKDRKTDTVILNFEATP